MKKIFKYIIKAILLLFVLLAIFVTYVVIEVKRNYPIELLENYEPLKPSIIYDINGNQIDVLAIENRDPIKINEIPLYVQNAFIAVEDKRFRSHHGLDYVRLTKAILLNVTRTGRQGGSTITQQLVKTAFLTPERSLKRKIIEAVLTYEMEKIYTKDEILENYLNTINFGKGAYGIKNASLRYFGVLPKDLTIAQAALLAGIPKSPQKYSKLEHGIKRQKIVLLSMLNAGVITKEEYEVAKNEKISFVTNEELENRPEAQEISNSNVSPEVTTIILSELKKILQLDNEDEDATKSLFNGYKIYSTVDINMQKAAYKAFETSAGLKKDKLQAALISIDPSNGFVKAIVGGKNYVKGDFNRAINAKRQPGSAFKPIVYMAALQNNIPMNLVVEDSPVKYGKWSPRNYDGKYRGNITMLKALEISNNIGAVKILDLVGIDKVKEVWELSRGQKSENFPKDLTLALGSITVTPLDMARMYASFANGGYRIVPQFIYKVENKDGEVIYEASNVKEKIYEPEDVALVTHLMQQVINNGTGKSAVVYKNGVPIPMAGKTGTTNEYISAWFTGYTPTLATVVYVGYDDNKSMGRGMSGSSVAIPIWKNYMQTVANLSTYDPSNFDFITDSLASGKLVQRTIDNVNGFIDDDGLNADRALFKAGTEPVEHESGLLNIFEY